MKHENHEICQYLMISCKEVVVKNWLSFAHLITHDVQKLKHLQRSFLELYRKQARFVGKVMLKLEFEFNFLLSTNSMYYSLSKFSNLCIYFLYLTV
jgi:hypothetical protein